MLDQDTARALLTIADETGARVAFVGDRHQLPAVGRGGVLDHAVAWAHPTAVVTLEKVHRFTDPDYAALSLRMRTGDDPAAVFDALHRRGQIVVHAIDVERTAALADAGAAGDLVIADTREHVADLNAAIRDHARADDDDTRDAVITTLAAIGSGSGTGSRPDATTPTSQVANRQTWTVTGIGRGRQPDPARPTGANERSRRSTRPGSSSSPTPPPSTAPRERPSTTPTSPSATHTGAAAAYVAMTRGRHGNTAHLVAETVEDARQQWIEVFGRDRADLGPAHARRQAIDAIDRYGPQRDAGRCLNLAPPSPARDDSLSI